MVGVHRGVHPSRRDRVETDVALGQVLRRTPGVGLQRRLGRAVVDTATGLIEHRRARRPRRSDVDDGPRALLLHERQHFAHDPHRRLEVDRDHPVELLVGDRPRVGVGHDAGVVDQAVDAAAERHAGAGDPLGRIAGGDVGDHHGDAGTELFDDPFRHRQKIRVHVDDHELRARRGEAFRERSSDTLPGTGDGDDLAGHVEQVAANVGNPESHGLPP